MKIPSGWWAMLVAGALVFQAELVQGGDSATPASGSAAQAASPPFDLNDPVRIEAGKKRFGSTCATYCHGSGGVGGRTAPGFIGRTDLTPSAAFKTITEGRVGTETMPAWGNALTPEQRWELVAYLKSLWAQAPAKN